MNYTSEELEYANYLLKLIGFTNEDKINLLLKHYEIQFSYVDFVENSKPVRNRKGQIYKYLKSRWKVINNEISLGMLRTEVELRINNQIELKEYEESDYISASDLSSFVFCPASFSISKSFKINYTLNQFKIENGNRFHEKLFFFKNKSSFGFSGDIDSNFTDKKITFLKKIHSCKLIFKGHKEKKNIFVNHEIKFIGQPDYIFKDPNDNYFVLEEKFHYRDPFKTTNNYNQLDNCTDDFFSNQLIQLQSYIEYIKDFEINYGIIVNWYYHYLDGELIVYNFTYKIVKKDYDKSLLQKTFEEILLFKKNKTLNFKNNVNINKCANCSVNLYCSHKTDNFEILKLPYNIDDLRLRNIDYLNNEFLYENA
jgi:CRISPR/Cas system-associated exonuclease Cas4 (RecB family)